VGMRRKGNAERDQREIPVQDNNSGGGGVCSVTSLVALDVFRYH
jgi:hypothetical protein